jgi:hypothetical protein
MAQVCAFFYPHCQCKGSLVRVCSANLFLGLLVILVQCEATTEQSSTGSQCTTDLERVKLNGAEGRQYEFLGYLQLLLPFVVEVIPVVLRFLLGGFHLLVGGITYDAEN